MKRSSLLGFGVLGLIASVLGGCPIWGDGSGQAVAVTGPSPCAQDGTCGQQQACGPENPCPTGSQCLVNANTGEPACIPVSGNGGSSGSGGSGGSGGSSTSPTTNTSSSSGGSGGSAATTTVASSSGTTTTSSTSGSSSSSSGAAVVYCGHPADCTDSQICGANGTCQPQQSNACDKDSDCPSGSACVAGPNGGVCTTAANQCFDQTQCQANEDCVNGKCTPTCTSNSDCRDGYTCNTATGVCTGVAQPCTITNDCGSPSLVCVGGACVPRSTNGSCPNDADGGSGDVWDENGCVPNEAPTFTCQNDGVQDACNAGSICLHHDCYISCNASTNTPCAQDPVLNTCKPVNDNGTIYNVCGSSSNLGSQCGAGSSNNASCSSGQVCIDGNCR